MYKPEHAKYVNEKVAYAALKKVLEEGLSREMTESEQSTIGWLANCEYGTVGNILDLFKELSKK